MKYILWINPISKREFLYRVSVEEEAYCFANLVVQRKPDNILYRVQSDLDVRFYKNVNEVVDE